MAVQLLPQINIVQKEIIVKWDRLVRHHVMLENIVMKMVWRHLVAIVLQAMNVLKEAIVQHLMKMEIQNYVLKVIIALEDHHQSHVPRVGFHPLELLVSEALMNVLSVLLDLIVMVLLLQLIVARDISVDPDQPLSLTNANPDFIVHRVQQHNNHAQLVPIHRQQEQSHVPIVPLVVFVNPMPMAVLKIPTLHVLADITVQQRLEARYYVLLVLMVQIVRDSDGSQIVLIVLLDIIVIQLIMVLSVDLHQD